MKLSAFVVLGVKKEEKLKTTFFFSTMKQLFGPNPEMLMFLLIFWSKFLRISH